MNTLEEFVGAYTATTGNRVGNYSAAALVRQYLQDVFQVSLGSEDNPSLYWTHTPDHLATWRCQPSYPEAHDVVVLSPDERHPDGHMVISTGQLAGSFFRALEQNGGVGAGTGMDTDAIRLRWIHQKEIMGVLRPGKVTSEKAKPPIMSYKAPAFARAPGTRTQVRNNRTGITYRLFTDADSTPITKTLYVNNKAGTVKRSFIHGMTDNMPIVGEVLAYRQEVECAGTAINRSNRVMYMSVADMADVYRLWRPTNSYGYLPDDLSDTKPPYESRWTNDDVTPEEVTGEPEPELEAQVAVPDWLLNAVKVQQREWRFTEPVTIIDLFTMKSIAQLDTGTFRVVTASINKDGVQYARLSSDDSEVLAVRAHNPRTGTLVMEQWTPPEPPQAVTWKTHYMRFISAAHTLLDRITPKE